MVVALPELIKVKCREFVSNYEEEPMEELPAKLVHDGRWKEQDDSLIEVTAGILDVL